MIQNAVDLVETIFHTEYGQVLAALISQFGDISLAEDAIQDALLTALETWPHEGIPRNPGAWILVVSRRRVVDRIRQEATFGRKRSLLIDPEPAQSNDQEANDMEVIPDERLKLMFTCCHPALAVDAQIALTLRTVSGLTTDEVARAFLVPVATMTKRLMRAKAKIRAARIPFRVPPAHLLPERLDTLLTVIYLIFTEGYSATRGAELIRRDLCTEAIRLSRILVNLLPEGPETADAYGVLALLLLHDSRRKARISPSGELVLLEDQNRRDWDHAQIDEGLAILERAFGMGKPGPYQVQAAISALHAQAATSQDTDWLQIRTLYDILTRMISNPVVQVNRAVAIAMAEGPQAGLRALMVVEGAQNYYPFHAARADLLRRSKDYQAAAAAYQQAIRLCRNEMERVYFAKRITEMMERHGNEP